MAGSITPEMVLEVGTRFGVPIPADTVEELRLAAVLDKPMDSLQQVLDCFLVFARLFVSTDVVRYIAGRVVEDAARDNVKYLELRFSPGFLAFSHDLNLAGVIEAVIEGTAEAAEASSTVVPLLSIASREMGPEVCMETFRLAARYRPHIAGVDLAGDEDNFPPELFRDAFDFARSAGLAATVHAGEQASPENVRTAVDSLHAGRIGHGIRIDGHDDLIGLLRDRRIPLEISITSNYIVGAVSSPETHPVCRLRRAGVPICINSDDPALFGITLSDEVELYGRLCGRTRDDLIADQLETLEFGFAPESDKAIVRGILHDWQTD